MRKLLHNADSQRWWSLSRDFQLLAEASPDAFFAALDESLDKNDPPIKVLFGEDGGPIFGGEHLSSLLWALESLAWAPERLVNILSAASSMRQRVKYSTGDFPTTSLNLKLNAVRDIAADLDNDSTVHRRAGSSCMHLIAALITCGLDRPTMVVPQPSPSKSE